MEINKIKLNETQYHVSDMDDQQRALAQRMVNLQAQQDDLVRQINELDLLINHYNGVLTKSLEKGLENGEREAAEIESAAG